MTKTASSPGMSSVITQAPSANLATSDDEQGDAGRDGAEAVDQHRRRPPRLPGRPPVADHAGL